MKIGIIGGSGLDDPKIISNYEEKEVETPYGKPSSAITCGKISGVDVCILARHGKKHEITPTQINNKANIYALKKLGCSHIIATSAVGSLREEIKPGDFVIPDQLIDFTRHRHITFHEDFKQGIVHASLADPFSEELRKKIIETSSDLGLAFHKKGTVITIEGPRFSTRAESNFFRGFAHVIGMTTAPEASLAREAGVEYASIAMSTDYDCWKEGEEDVTMDMVLRRMKENADKVKTLLVKTIEKFSEEAKMKENSNFIKSKIRTIPNWPKPGIMFRDITTLIKDAEGFAKTLEIFENRYKNKEIDYIAGIESRGFILASALASRLGKGLVVIRKPGKLPAETIRQEYDLEYGKDAVEIHKDAIKPGDKVLLIDDLLATGGTAFAAASLIEKLGGKVAECAFVVDLPKLGGSQKLIARWPVFSVLDFEGE